MSAPNREQAEHWNNRDEVAQWIDEKVEHDQMLEQSPSLHVSAFGGRRCGHRRISCMRSGRAAVHMAMSATRGEVRPSAAPAIAGKSRRCRRQSSEMLRPMRTRLLDGSVSVNSRIPHG